MHAGFIVESKKNNSELFKSVAKIEDEADTYYILMDQSVDNPNVFRETQRLYAAVRGKRNIHVVPLHSFEFALLPFSMLEDWIFAGGDELKEKRADILRAKDLFVEIMTEGGDASKLSALKKELDISDFVNSEQISSKLLFEITRNTGFETTKGKFGDCYIVDCCEWTLKKDDDICGLDDGRLTGTEKMKEVFRKSVLKEAFAKVGL